MINQTDINSGFRLLFIFKFTNNFVSQNIFIIFFIKNKDDINVKFKKTLF